MPHHLEATLRRLLRLTKWTLQMGLQLPECHQRLCCLPLQMGCSQQVQKKRQRFHRVLRSKRVHQTLLQKGWVLLRNLILPQKYRMVFHHWWVGQRLQDWFLVARAPSFRVCLIANLLHRLMLVFLHRRYRMHHCVMLVLRQELFIRHSCDTEPTYSRKHRAIDSFMCRAATSAASVLVPACRTKSA